MNELDVQTGSIVSLRYEHERTVEMDFDKYLKEPHFSNSKISEIERGYPIVTTSKMTLGKEVDMILANGHPGTGLSKQAVKIAAKIESSPSWVLVSGAKKQPSIFGRFVIDGVDGPMFTAPFKTRPDFLGRNCTVDLKVTESRLKYLPGLIEQMKYPRQMWIHRTMAHVEKSYLMIHSIPDKKTILIPSEEDWTDQLMNFIMLYG
jgi:hypothetical protein